MHELKEDQASRTCGSGPGGEEAIPLRSDAERREARETQRDVAPEKDDLQNANPEKGDWENNEDIEDLENGGKSAAAADDTREECLPAAGEKGLEKGSGRQSLTPRPPDGGWGWMVVTGAALGFCLSGGLSRSFTLIYQELLVKFGQNAATTSSVAAIFGTVKMCTSPVVSVLCVRCGARPVVVAGGLVTCAALLLSAFPPSLYYLYASYGVLAAFGINLAMTPSFVLLGRYFRRRKGRAMALAMLGGSVGGICMPPLVHFLFRHYGYTGAMLVLAALFLNLCVTGALFRPLVSDAQMKLHKMELRAKHDSKRHNGNGVECATVGDSKSLAHHTARDADSIDDILEPTVTNRKVMFQSSSPLPSSNVSQESLGLPTPLAPPCERQASRTSTSSQPKLSTCAGLSAALGLHLLRRPRFLSFSILMLGSIFSLSISGVFLSGLVRQMSLDVSHTALLLSVSGAADIPSKFISGFVFDHPKVRPVRSLPLAALGFLTGSCVLGMALCRTYPALMAVYLFYTFFASAYHTQHATVVSDIVEPRELAQAMGLCRLFQGVGFALGPTVGGHLVDVTGNYCTPYFLAAGALLTSAAIFTIADCCFLQSSRHIFTPIRRHKSHVVRYRHDSISTVDC